MKKGIRIFCSLLMGLLLFQSFFIVNAQENKKQLQFNKNGDFTIMQVSDTQDTHELSADTIYFLETALDTYKPDVVVFTGDQIEGYCSTFKKDGEAKVKQAIDALVAPLVKRNVPFAVTFGNHDDQCGISKEKQMEFYSSYENCLSFDEGDKLDGCGTNNFVVKSSDGQTNAMNIYVVDSMGDAPEGGYLSPSKGQIEFCKNVADELKKENGGEVVPSILFQHIPVQEIYNALTLVEKGGVSGYRSFNDRQYVLNDSKLVGDVENYVLGEAPCPSNKNSGQFKAWVESGDVFAAYFGHDHKNNFATTYAGIDLGYCPTSGFNSYGDKLNRGIRVFKFNEDNVKDYTTFTAYYGDLIGKDLKEPFAYVISQYSGISFKVFMTKLPLISLAMVAVLAVIITVIVLIVKKVKKSKIITPME